MCLLSHSAQAFVQVGSRRNGAFGSLHADADKEQRGWWGGVGWVLKGGGGGGRMGGGGDDDLLNPFMQYSKREPRTR